MEARVSRLQPGALPASLEEAKGSKAEVAAPGEDSTATVVQRAAETLVVPQAPGSSEGRVAMELAGQAAPGLASLLWSKR